MAYWKMIRWFVTLVVVCLIVDGEIAQAAPLRSFKGFVQLNYELSRSRGATRHEFLLNEAELDFAHRFSRYVSLAVDANLVHTHLRLDTAIALVDALFEQAIIDLNFTGKHWTLRLRLGKFNSPLGLEPTDGNEKSEVTPGILGVRALPGDLTGLSVYGTYKWLSLELFVVNGWDQLVDLNSDKTVGAVVSLRVDPVLVQLGVISGRRQPLVVNPEHLDARLTAANLSLQLLLLKFGLEVVLEAVLGHVAGIAGGQLWWGVEATVTYKPVTRFGVSGRYMIFRDAHGLSVLPGQSEAASLTLQWLPVAVFRLLGEYRVDLQQGKITAQTVVVSAIASF